jgi:uncharacterized SAM-binding protein YcdF (DUF218 family)
MPHGCAGASGEDPFRAANWFARQNDLFIGYSFCIRVTPEHAVDLLADFLALRAPLPPSADAAILLGNAVVACADVAAHLLRDEVVQVVVLSGGIGHSTPLLRQASGIDEANLSEAEIFAILLNQRGIDGSRLRLETRSTNTGGNAL